MSGARRRSRIYWRKPGAGIRAYGDFRDYQDVGGRREALIPEGESRATTDRIIADKLVADRLRELQERRRNKVLLGVQRDATLYEFAAQHLVKKAQSHEFAERWLESVQLISEQSE